MAFKYNGPMKLTFGPATHLDIDPIKTLMESVFGTYPKLEDILARWIQHDHFNVVVAKADEKTVGVGTWCVKQDVDLSEYESYGAPAMDFLKSHQIAWPMNLAVDPEYRRNNIGLRLSLAQLSWLEEKNCTAVVGTSWVHGEDANSQHLYLKAGFSKLGESKEFLRLQMQNGAVCSVCKTLECHCRSILFGIQASDLLKFSSENSVKDL